MSKILASTKLSALIGALLLSALAMVGIASATTGPIVPDNCFYQAGGIGFFCSDNHGNINFIPGRMDGGSGSPGPTGPTGPMGIAGPTGNTNFPTTYLNGAGPSDELITLDGTRGGLIIDSSNAGTFDAPVASFLSHGSQIDPNTGAVVGVSINSNGELDGYAAAGLSHLIRLAGGFDDGVSNHTQWDNGFLVMPAPTIASASNPGGQLILRAGDGVAGAPSGGLAAGGINLIAGLAAPGGAPAAVFMGQPASAWNVPGLTGLDFTKPFITSGDGVSSGPELFGGGSLIALDTGSTTPNVRFSLSEGGILGFRFHIASADVLQLTANRFYYTGNYPFDNNVLTHITTVQDGSASSDPILLVSTNNGALPRLAISGNHSFPLRAFGTIFDTTGAQLVAVSSTESSPFHGAAVQLDATANGGQTWRLLNLHESLGFAGADAFYLLSQVGGGHGIVITQGGTLLPQDDNTDDLGTSTRGWKDFYMSGQLKSYNGSVVQGLTTIAKRGTVASVGGGAQSTTVISYTPPASGMYRISAVASVTTSDTVTATATWTDSANNQPITKTLSFGVVALNDSNSLTPLLAQASANPIVVTITLSAQTTTKVGAVIEGMQ